jgi:6-phosphogluconolactonase (cycloisomerase 2 family)
MISRTSLGLKISLILFASSFIFYFTQCAKQEGYAPALPAVIKTVVANNGGPLYCSISGGCPLTITGENFADNAKIYVGPYPCESQIINETKTQIDCVIGPGQNGVYDLNVKNGGVQSSILDPSITDPTSMQFSYASFMYIASQETPGKVYAYAQHPTTGALLTIAGSPFSIAGHNSSYGVVIHPNNRFLYAANVASSTVSIYSIDPQTGALTAVGTPVASGGSGANGLFFHPSGNYLYVTNAWGNSVSGFSVAADGLLTALPGSPYATTGATTINGVVVSNAGKYLYAASMGGNGGVVAYTIDQSTGVLTTIPGSPFINSLGGDTSNPGDGIGIHPNGQWLYMGLVGLRKISGWSIDSTTGVLTPIEAPVLNNATTGYVDNGGSASTISKDGLFLYGTAFSSSGADPKKIIVYSIDQTTGGLTRSSEADTGGGPNDVRLDTNGLFAYTCNSKNPPSISSFSVNTSTGALTALSPRDYAIPAPSSGPGIMVMQRNLAATPVE